MAGPGDLFLKEKLQEGIVALCVPAPSEEREPYTVPPVPPPLGGVHQAPDPSEVLGEL